MRKITIIGSGIVLLVVLYVLIWQHFAPPSDAEIQQKIAGSWTHEKETTTWNFTPDGSCFFSQPKSHQTNSPMGGTWQIRNSVLIMTITNSPSIGSVVRYRIFRVDKRQLVYENSGQTNRESVRIMIRRPNTALEPTATAP